MLAFGGVAPKIAFDSKLQSLNQNYEQLQKKPGSIPDHKRRLT